jgi:DNA-binding LacI/PurR family transcriptional regulator
MKRKIHEMATIKDVARKAGVSIGTVSRAFNGYKDIPETTRHSILKVAEEMGYVPNINARSLSAKKKPNIAMLMSGILEERRSDEMPYLLMKGAFQYASKSGMNIATYSIDSKLQREKTYDQFCYEHSLAGTLLFGLRTTDLYFKSLQKSAIPCVTVDVTVKGPLIGSVIIDDAAAFEDLTEYLVRNNHRKIAILYGRRQAEVTSKRWQGAKRALDRHGLTCPKSRIIETDFDYDKAYQRVRRYLECFGTSDATAFLCMSDLTAIGAMQAIKDLGYHVPDDFSLAGYDGSNITRYTDPGITTIDQSPLEKGYAAAQLLSEIIADPKAARQLVLPHKLIARDSIRKI